MMLPLRSAHASVSRRRSFLESLAGFRGEGIETLLGETVVDLGGGAAQAVPTYTNAYWTARQRQSHSLHEVSYRACFKPLLPRFFIERLTEPGERVHDPFLGRGTTALEAALLGRRSGGCDVNPLALLLAAPRLTPPSLEQVAARLAEIPWRDAVELRDDLAVFYHPDTLQEVCALRRWFLARAPLDPVDAWIRMVALNRLTGHSRGFFSVYTLPPNHMVPVQAQRRLNAERNQVPPRRDVPALILRKTAQLFRHLTATQRGHLAAAEPRLWTGRAQDPGPYPPASVDLVVTSPPFLDVLDYLRMNWLRLWFAGIEGRDIELTSTSSLPAWQEAMLPAFQEMARVLRPGGFAAFEVGEVKCGRLLLEEAVLPVALRAGFAPVCVVVHAQAFTKTARCWGILNNRVGTNSNRIVVLERP